MYVCLFVCLYLSALHTRVHTRHRPICNIYVYILFFFLFNFRATSNIQLDLPAVGFSIVTFTLTVYNNFEQYIHWMMIMMIYLDIAD